METRLPDPGRLSALWLLHDGPLPDSARRLAGAACPQSARSALAKAQADFFDHLFQQSRQALAGARRRRDKPEVLARLYASLLSHRSAGLGYRRLAGPDLPPWPE